MRCQGLKSFFGFVGVSLEEEEESLFSEKLAIVINFVFGDVVVEFVQFFAFVLVMGGLSEKEEASALLALFCLLLLLWVG
jgi:hypothetical protein